MSSRGPVPRLATVTAKARDFHYEPCRRQPQPVPACQAWHWRLTGKAVRDPMIMIMIMTESSEAGAAGPHCPSHQAAAATPRRRLERVTGGSGDMKRLEAVTATRAAVTVAPAGLTRTVSSHRSRFRVRVPRSAGPTP
jgi:hypothetical protein